MGLVQVAVQPATQIIAQVFFLETIITLLSQELYSPNCVTQNTKRCAFEG